MPRETGVGFGWNCLNWKPDLNEDPSLEDSPLPIPLFSKVGEVLFRKTDWDPMSCCGWQLDEFDARDLQMWYRSLRLIIVTKILAVFEDFLGKKKKTSYWHAVCLPGWIIHYTNLQVLLECGVQRPSVSGCVSHEKSPACVLFTRHLA